MAAGLSSGPAGARAARLADVRGWWRVARPRAPISQRLYVVYCAALVGLLAYGAITSTVKAVLTPGGLADWGPPLAIVALVATVRWGTVQGPVVFGVADVAHLLAAPLPRRGLVQGRLVRALAGGAGVGALLGACTILGLMEGARSIAPSDGAGLVAGLALGGVAATAGAWAAQSSARFERAVHRATWPLLALAVVLAWSGASGVVPSDVALWSGPWGWAVAPGAGGRAWALGLAALALLASVAAVAAVRASGACPTERHLDRAHARSGVVASLASFNARTARRTLADVSARSSARRPGDLRWLRDAAGRATARAAGGGSRGGPAVGGSTETGAGAMARAAGRRGRGGPAVGGREAPGAGAVARATGRSRAGPAVDGHEAPGAGAPAPARGLRPDPATVWRDAVTAVRARDRLARAVLLAGAGTLLTVLDAAAPLAVIAGTLACYVAAAGLLEPLRVEIDVPSRMLALLRASRGRVLVTHAIVPAAVVVATGAAVATVAVISGNLPRHGVAVAVVAVGAGPAIVLCAALSARRGGTLPLNVLMVAVGTDPSGGAGVVLAWLLLWPVVAVALGAAPAIVAATDPAGAVSLALGCCVAAPCVLAVLLGREPSDA